MEFRMLQRRNKPKSTIIILGLKKNKSSLLRGLVDRCYGKWS